MTSRMHACGAGALALSLLPTLASASMVQDFDVDLESDFVTATSHPGPGALLKTVFGLSSGWHGAGSDGGFRLYGGAPASLAAVEIRLDVEMDDVKEPSAFGIRLAFVAGTGAGSERFSSIRSFTTDEDGEWSFQWEVTGNDALGFVAGGSSPSGRFVAEMVSATGSFEGEVEAELRYVQVPGPSSLAVLALLPITGRRRRMA